MALKLAWTAKEEPLTMQLQNGFLRTIKWEDIYIMQYETPKALRQGIDAYIRYYNHERGHQSLDGCRPADLYYAHSNRQQELIA